MKILERFNVSDANPVGSILPTNSRLNAKQCPKGEKEKAEMMKVPYTDNDRSDILIKNLSVDRLRVCQQKTGLTNSLLQE